MQFKDHKDKIIAFRLNKQLMCHLEQASLDLSKSLGTIPSKQKVFEMLLAFYLHKRGLL